MLRQMMARMLFGGIVLGALWGFAQVVEAQEKKAKNPEEGKKGTTVGMLVNVVVGDKGNYIEVKGDGEEKARKFVPEWVGGAPAKGGGPDKEILKIYRELKVGSRVEVDWVFHERLRSLKVKVLRAAPEKKEN